MIIVTELKERLELLMAEYSLFERTQVSLLQLLGAPHRELDIMAILEHAELQDLLEVIIRWKQILSIVILADTVDVDLAVLCLVDFAEVEVEHFSLLRVHHRYHFKNLLRLMDLVFPAEVLDACYVV